MRRPRPTVESERIAALREREIAILAALDGQPRHRWFRPMDLGAWDASHHSATLLRLAKKGIVERRPRGGLANFLGSRRGPYVYRLTKAGVRVAREATLHQRGIPAPFTSHESKEKP